MSSYKQIYCNAQRKKGPYMLYTNNEDQDQIFLVTPALDIQPAKRMEARSPVSVSVYERILITIF